MFTSILRPCTDESCRHRQGPSTHSYGGSWRQPERRSRKWLRTRTRWFRGRLISFWNRTLRTGAGHVTANRPVWGGNLRITTLVRDLWHRIHSLWCLRWGVIGLRNVFDSNEILNRRLLPMFTDKAGNLSGECTDTFQQMKHWIRHKSLSVLQKLECRECTRLRLHKGRATVRDSSGSCDWNRRTSCKCIFYWTHATIQIRFPEISSGENR